MNVTDVLSQTRHVLLDFDGPICAVFGATADQAVADQLRSALRTYVHAIPHQVLDSSDPFDVLRYSATVSRRCVERIDELFTHLEQHAVMTAPATPGAPEAVAGLNRAGHTVTIVSNNSAPAIAAYVDAHELSETITTIVGRTAAAPDLLKPHPHLVNQAIRRLRAQPSQCVLIGDSVTDVMAAHAAGVASIGYANRPGKRARFAELGPAAIIEAMSELTAAAVR